MDTPAHRYGHSVDLATGAYLRPVRLFPSADGTWPLPENVVAFAPTVEPGPYQWLRLDAARQAWELVPDYRGAMLWDTGTATPLPNRLQLGDDLPEGLTVLPPLTIEPGAPLRNVWNAQAQAWELIPDYSGRPLWHKADGSVASPLPPGEPLPDELTDMRPPADVEAPVRFVEPEGWIQIARPSGQSVV
ncbi:hypothetical protein [Stenotrophomonas sp. B1-1]|uniref:hypothetical protein n=1 Tax=Stenotrophomonas sp. B1-1 TaxID=2710648 RepID=UPI0013DB6F7E|nr:hypothetical protein [Stenotrophomonas sp. B1-1]